jgi:hypothetical protein
MHGTEVRALGGDRRQRVQKIAGRAGKPLKPRHHQHVAIGKLVESAAQLGALGLRAACGFLKYLLGSGGAQLLHLRVEALAVGRYLCIAVNHARILLLYSAPGKPFLVKGIFYVRNSCLASRFFQNDDEAENTSTRSDRVQGAIQMKTVTEFFASLPNTIFMLTVLGGAACAIYALSAVRLVLAIGAALLTVFVMLAVFSRFGADLTWSALDYLFPTISNLTENTNTDDWGDLLVIPLALAAGLTCGALIFDPKLSKKTETFTAIIVFILLMFVSGVNFWSRDNLINVNVQAAIDIFLSITSLIVIGLLMRWSPSSITTGAIQRIVLFLVTAFGLVLPLFYATNLLMIRFGFPKGATVGIPDWIKFVTGILGFSAALAPTLKRVAKSDRHT